MRFRISGAAILAVAALIACAAPARAADNYPVRDGTGASQTFCSKQIGGVQHPCHVMEGLNGNAPRPVAVDGSGNLSVNVQSAVLPSGAATSAAQTTGNGFLDQIATNTTGVATADNQAAANAKLDTLVAATSGFATAANQAAAQAAPGSNATKAVAVQGCTGCKPVQVTEGALPASGITPVSGSFSATGQSASFTPIAGRAFNVTLRGTFAATVRLERSFDGGTTWDPLTGGGFALFQWTAPASESRTESEVGVIYRLNCTAYTSGTITYRVSQ